MKDSTDPERVGVMFHPFGVGMFLIRDPWALPTAIESHACGVEERIIEMITREANDNFVRSMLA